MKDSKGELMKHFHSFGDNSSPPENSIEPRHEHGECYREKIRMAWGRSQQTE